MEKPFIPEPTYRVSFLFRRILVPVDGSENSLRALDVAIDFARRYGSKIIVLYVAEPDVDPSKIRELVEKRIGKHGVEWSFKVRQCTPTVSSIANEIIQEVIENGYDLVIMGARGNTANEELLIGSTALSVTINTSASIMIIR